jgi:hypothetical protein
LVCLSAFGYLCPKEGSAVKRAFGVSLLLNLLFRFNIIYKKRLKQDKVGCFTLFVAALIAMVTKGDEDAAS